MNSERLSLCAPKQCIKLDDKKEQVHVFVRVRPPNGREQCGKSLMAIEVKSNKEIMVHTKPNEQISKTFKFDKIFGPKSTQREIYHTVVSPLLRETLSGYNCTLFAYGPTGTGKTYTMEGILDRNKNQAGIIPLFLTDLFNELHTIEKMDCMVKISCLEIYNEELFDLLSSTDEVTKVRIYENTSKKGSVILQGLSEIMVNNETQVHEIFKKVSEKRQKTSTQLNANSSRSHVIFSIILNFKEDAENGQSLMRMGKLNLVDLAGSENIRKSGAFDSKAKEAGNINQSLLTLGRVITALAEKAPHVPYRESKLTRLLQESLGGPTKTSIIATVSPSQLCVEETLSTLEYACRAKNITNKPQINQQLSEEELLKAWSSEITKLRQELLIAQEQNGVYIAKDNYEKMQKKIEDQRLELKNLSITINQLENNIEAKEVSIRNLQAQDDEICSEWNEVNQEQYKVELNLIETKRKLSHAEKDLEKEKLITEEYVSNEGKIRTKVKKVSDIVKSAVADSCSLKEKIDRQNITEQRNQQLSYGFEKKINRELDFIKNDIVSSTKELTSFCNSIKNEIDITKNQTIENIENMIDQMISKQLISHNKICSDLMESTKNSYKPMDEFFAKDMKNLSCVTQDSFYILREISENFTSITVNPVLNEIIQNMQDMQNHFREILANSVKRVKDNLDRIQTQQLIKYDSIIKNLYKVQENMEKVSEQHRENTQHRKSLALALQNANSHLQEMVNERSIESLLEDNLEICDVIKNQAIDNYDEDVRTRQTFYKTNQETWEQFKSHLSENLEKNAIIRECSTHTTESNIALNQSLDILMALKESNISKLTELGTQIENIQLDCNSNLKIQVPSDLSKESECFKKINDQQFTNIEGHLSYEMDGYKNVIENKYQGTIASINSMRNQVDQFILEDWNRDVPTGSTPRKKGFNYPRQFSPVENSNK